VFNHCSQRVARFKTSVIQWCTKFQQQYAEPRQPWVKWLATVKLSGDPVSGSLSSPLPSFQYWKTFTPQSNWYRGALSHRVKQSGHESNHSFPVRERLLTAVLCGTKFFYSTDWCPAVQPWMYNSFCLHKWMLKMSHDTLAMHDP